MSPHLTFLLFPAVHPSEFVPYSSCLSVKVKIKWWEDPCAAQSWPIKYASKPKGKGKGNLEKAFRPFFMRYSYSLIGGVSAQVSVVTAATTTIIITVMNMEILIKNSVLTQRKESLNHCHHHPLPLPISKSSDFCESWRVSLDPKFLETLKRHEGFNDSWNFFSFLVFLQMRGWDFLGTEFI